MIYKEKPFEIEVEPVRGCNMACDFCGNFSLPKEPDFMSAEVYKETARKVSYWDGVRVIFCGRGEPLLHPAICDMLMEFRGWLPNSQITIMTNGLLMKQSGIVKQLFSSGLNYLAVDAYGGTKRELEIEQYCQAQGFPYIYSENLNIWKNNGSRKRAVVILSDLRKGTDSTRKISWRCGAVNPAVYKKYGIVPVLSPLSRRCSRPFREFEILWDGTIPLCCYDWTVKVPMANIRMVTAKEYWESNETLNAARNLLYRKNREFAPCDKCDYNGGVRLGLLKEPL